MVVTDAKNILVTTMFLNRRAAAQYWALASIILCRERPEETTICYKISLVQLITNLNVILYFLTCHTVYISVLTLRLLMSYIYGAPSKARNANVVYIWTYVWQR